MERPAGRSEAELPQLRGFTPGATTIGSQVDRDVLAYLVRSEAAVYVDPPNVARVAGALDATIDGARMQVRRGRPFSGDKGFLLSCAIRPLHALPGEKPVDVGDAMVMQDHVCTLVAPGSCCIVFPADGSPAFSFKAPSYGLSWCGIAPGETCVSWAAQEVCETFVALDCRPAPGFNRPITAWVCSLP